MCLGFKLNVMKTIEILVCFLFISLSQGCVTKQELVPSPKLENGELVYQVPDSKLTPEQQELKMKFVHMIPDSIATPQQKELKAELTKVVTACIKVENNRMVLRATKKDFEQRGIPAYYYDRIKYELKVNNRFIRENKMDNVEETYQKTLEAYR